MATGNLDAVTDESVLYDDHALEHAAEWRAAGKNVALATVIQTWGSSPRPVGSKLAVDQAYRRRGILRSLITFAQDMARAEGKSALELQTRVELVENHATFAALGFTKSGETAHAGYDRPTSITMWKAL